MFEIFSFWFRSLFLPVTELCPAINTAAPLAKPVARARGDGCGFAVVLGHGDATALHKPPLHPRCACRFCWPEPANGDYYGHSHKLSTLQLCPTEPSAPGGIRIARAHSGIAVAYPAAFFI